MILQGSNTPLTLTFDESMSGVTTFSAVLVAGRRIVKTWSMSDVGVNDTTILLPLTEAETASFPSGEATLDVKWLDGATVMFAQTVRLTIEPRSDKEVVLG